nr:unnamed protein product [Callosobruchus analis]
MTHFENNDLFHHNQFGFSPKKFTTDALVCIVDKIIKVRNVEKWLVILNKLKSYNFQKDSINLITSYLLYRSQYVEAKNDKSNIRNVKCGVPQGSVI